MEEKGQDSSVVWPRTVKESSWNRWPSQRILKDNWNLDEWEEIREGGRNFSIKEEEEYTQ